MSQEYEPMSRTKVMIVEDEIISAMDTRANLIQLGYDVCELAASGEDAVKIAELEKPDVVLMDIGLRGKMDGIEAGRQIKAQLAVPVIFLTGYTDEEVKARVEGYGGCLVKPIDPKDVEKAIEKVLSGNKDITSTF